MVNVDIKEINSIAIKAGQKILAIYNQNDFLEKIELKGDSSPITIADKAANKIIVDQLQNLYPSIPIISEEEKNTEFELRKGWETFWLVDPLDGTKEFINKNGEFTVNISLIYKGNPIMGVIYAPVLDRLYYGILMMGAFKEENGNITSIKVNNRINNLIAVGSRSHASEQDSEYLKSYDVKELTSIGSSLKFCLVAEGLADLYYRSGPTMEWDTAAGHAIVIAAGGKVEGLTYNKTDLKNSSFVCKGF